MSNIRKLLPTRLYKWQHRAFSRRRLGSKWKRTKSSRCPRNHLSCWEERADVSKLNLLRRVQSNEDFRLKRVGPGQAKRNNTQAKEREMGHRRKIMWTRKKAGTAKYVVKMCKRQWRSALLAYTGFTINVPMRVTFYAAFVICASRPPVDSLFSLDCNSSLIFRCRPYAYMQAI